MVGEGSDIRPVLPPTPPGTHLSVKQALRSGNDEPFKKFSKLQSFRGCRGKRDSPLSRPLREDRSKGLTTFLPYSASATSRGPVKPSRPMQGTSLSQRSACTTPPSTRE